MEYRVLLVGLDYELFEYLRAELERVGIFTTYALTAGDGIRLFIKNRYALVIIALGAIRGANQREVLAGLRRAKFMPILVLSDESEAPTTAWLIDYGVDMCLPTTAPPLVIYKHAVSLVRRYTAYNQYDSPDVIDAVPFRRGDIYIDPLRRTVIVRGNPIELRPREFSLLLYFMKNPGIVLTWTQIQEHAWGEDGGYEHSVVQAVHALRKNIEPNPSKPIYIQTVYRVGYRFVKPCRNLRTQVE